MKQHDFFNILLHEDGELSSFAGADVVARETIHQWPLSCVERVTFSDDRTLIYKAQISDGTEAAFYCTAVSRHIPRCEGLQEEGINSWLLLEDVKGAPPSTLPAQDAWAMCETIRKAIDQIDVPRVKAHDLSQHGLLKFVEESADLLGKLIQQGIYMRTDRTMVADFCRVLASQMVQDAACMPSALLQGDLKLDNILIRPDGTVVILDWARALYGPKAIDAGKFMVSCGHDPISYIGVGAEILRLAQEVRWFVDCQSIWFPEGKYDANTVGLIRRMVHLEKHGRYTGEDIYVFNQ